MFKLLHSSVLMLVFILMVMIVACKEENSKPKSNKLSADKSTEKYTESISLEISDLEPLLSLLRQFFEKQETLTSVQQEKAGKQLVNDWEKEAARLTNNWKRSIILSDVEVVDIWPVELAMQTPVLFPENLFERKDQYVVALRNKDYGEKKISINPIIVLKNEKQAANINKGRRDIKCNLRSLSFNDVNLYGAILLTNFYVVCENPAVIKVIEGVAEEAARIAAEEARIAAEEAEKMKSANTFTDPRDGKKYKTVKIGSQTWMARNLDYGGANDDIGRCYDRKSENCKKYGSLYSWDEAMKVCPKGWHLPSDKEWQVLVDFAGGDEAAGKKLKSKSGWSKHECKYTIESVSDRGKVTVTEHDNCAVTDEYGFAAFSGGFGFSGGSSYNVGNGGGWWSATESDASNAWNRIMHYSYELVVRGNSDKSYLLSVRCLQD